MASANVILVVDDDPLVRATIVGALGELGYQTAEAANGEAALAALHADEPPSLVVLDYVMPGMDGAEVARRIAAMDPDLPVIFSTGHAALRALRSAAGDDVPVLSKPFTLAELDDILRERLSERRRVRTA